MTSCLDQGHLIVLLLINSISPDPQYVQANESRGRDSDRISHSNGVIGVAIVSGSTEMQTIWRELSLLPRTVFERGMGSVFNNVLSTYSEDNAPQDRVIVHELLLAGMTGRCFLLDVVTVVVGRIDGRCHGADYSQSYRSFDPPRANGHTDSCLL